MGCCWLLVCLGLYLFAIGVLLFVVECVWVYVFGVILVRLCLWCWVRAWFGLDGGLFVCLICVGLCSLVWVCVSRWWFVFGDCAVSEFVVF